MSENAKIGIVADDYKLIKFKKVLKQKGFTNFKVSRFTETTSTITVKLKAENIGLIKKICEDVEQYFKALKN